MKKIVYSVSFPRTGTHYIGYNMHKLYSATFEVNHNIDYMKNEMVMSVIRDPFENIISDTLHHAMLNNYKITKNNLENGVKKYINYYNEASEHKHVFWLPFELLSHNFMKFGQIVSERFGLAKTEDHDKYIEDKPKDILTGQRYLATTKNGEQLDFAKNIMQDLDLSDCYKYRNQLLNSSNTFKYTN